MIISAGYWRASLDTYNILPCSEGFEGCKGGQFTGENLCLEGYMGPIC